MSIVRLFQISILLFCFFTEDILSQNLKKIYIFKFKVTGSEDKTIEKKIRNTLILNIINQFKDKYSILDEESILELSQKLKKLQMYGCSDEICIKEISNAIEADEFISGEISIQKDVLKVDMRNTLKNKDTFETSIKSIVNESFSFSQLEYFLGEIAKKLLNPSYTINKKNAPVEFSSELQFSSFKLADPEKLPSISLTYKGEKKFEALFDTLKTYVSQADMLFAEKDFKNSLKSYQALLDTILESVRPEEQSKLSELVTLIKERIRINQSVIFGNELKELDEKSTQIQTDSEEAQESLEKYQELLTRHMLLKGYEQNSKIEIAIRERLILIYEKKAETAYKSLEFSKASEYYQKAISYSNFPELKKKKQTLSANAQIVSQSAINYLENVIKSSCDEAELLNTKYEIEYKTMKSSEARKYKNQAISIMEKTFELAQKEKNFITPYIAQYYDHTVQNINRDIGESVLTTENIFLSPIRYVGNLVKGLSDIFVIKLGWGLGAAGELVLIGGGAGYGYFPLEYSTAYYRKPSKLQKSEVETGFFRHNKGADIYEGAGYVYLGTCGNGIIRICKDIKKYSSSNVWMGAGPAIFVAVELHRLVEYVGVIFFQDWDLIGHPTKRFQYFSYKKLDTLSNSSRK